MLCIVVFACGLGGVAAFDSTPMTTAETAETATLIGDAPLVTAAAFAPLCAPTNANGCTFSDIVCNGYNCCCVYSCSGGGTDVGPCQSTSPFL